jgi:hypothetical protein
MCVPIACVRPNRASQSRVPIIRVSALSASTPGGGAPGNSPSGEWFVLERQNHYRGAG